MRPTPSETIAGIRAILKEVVEPEVRSEHALSRLREIRAVLAQIDWDDAALHLRRRTDALRDLLDDVAGWIDGAAERADRLAGLRGRIAARAQAPAETFDELNARYAADAALLVEAGDALAEWSRTHPDAGPAESGRALRDRILERLVL